jgi:hypothetical protein
LSQGDDSDVLVYGGLAHGISVGDVLLVYDIDAGRTFMGKATVKDSYATCATIVPDPPIRGDRTFYCKLIPNFDKLRVYYDLSTVTNLPDAVHPYYTAQPENAVILIYNAPGFEDKYLFSFGASGDDDVFSDNVGHRFLTPVPVDKVMEILNEMFRFRRLLATPKSVNVDGGVKEMSSATAIQVVFHSVKRQHTKMELDMTLGWHEDKTSPSIETPLGYKTDIKVKQLDGRHTRQSYLNRSDWYGFSITNLTGVELFAYVICFSTHNLTICLY